MDSKMHRQSVEGGQDGSNVLPLTSSSKKDGQLRSSPYLSIFMLVNGTWCNLSLLRETPWRTRPW